MPSYVEQATLRVKDESTKPVKKINRALKDLFRTARRGQNIPIKFKGLDEAEKKLRNIRQLTQGLSRGRTMRVSVTVRGLNELNQKLGGLSRRKAIVIPVRLSGIDKAISQARQLSNILNGLSRRSVTPGVSSPRQPAVVSPRS